MPFQVVIQPQGEAQSRIRRTGRASDFQRCEKPGEGRGNRSAEAPRQNLPGLSQDNKEARAWVGQDVSVS